ncbi:PREDICTED: uncharacterized protein LOC106815463, partial [Priapulus caudatus]|uniref:Uncharacterized protein LOC106815463 n=1 Tax=Priapulus caudatus TaxID=37621 RepID=A0ABM1ET88_PRICU
LDAVFKAVRIHYWRILIGWMLEPEGLDDDVTDDALASIMTSLLLSHTLDEASLVELTEVMHTIIGQHVGVLANRMKAYKHLYEAVLPPKPQPSHGRRGLPGDHEPGRLDSEGQTEDHEQANGEASENADDTRGRRGAAFVANYMRFVANHLASKQDVEACRKVAALAVEQANVLVETRAVCAAAMQEEVAGCWSQFVKLLLRHLYENDSALKLIGALCWLMYESNAGATAEGALAVQTIHQMALSHSQFLSVMLDESGCMRATKAALVSLMMMLVTFDPACCESSHVAVLLGGYAATLSHTDRQLLHLVALYETNGVSLQEHRPFFWGPPAIEHYNARKDVAPSLWKEAKMDAVLELLSEERMMNLATNFPLSRRLSEDVCHATLHGQSEDAYDPCFLLPLFSHLLSPGKLVNCTKFVEVNALGVTLAALGSKDAAMRGAAYHVLVSFYQQLEGSTRASETAQLTHLLECVRDGIRVANQKLPSVVAVFLARAVRLLLTPAKDKSAQDSISIIITIIIIIDMTVVVPCQRGFHGDRMREIVAVVHTLQQHEVMRRNPYLRHQFAELLLALLPHLSRVGVSAATWCQYLEMLSIFLTKPGAKAVKVPEAEDEEGEEAEKEKESEETLEIAEVRLTLTQVVGLLCQQVCISGTRLSLLSKLQPPSPKEHATRGHMVSATTDEKRSSARHLVAILLHWEPTSTLTPPAGEILRGEASTENAAPPLSIPGVEGAAETMTGRRTLPDVTTVVVAILEWLLGDAHATLSDKCAVLRWTMSLLCLVAAATSAVAHDDDLLSRLLRLYPEIVADTAEPADGATRHSASASKPVGGAAVDGTGVPQPVGGASLQPPLDGATVDSTDARLRVLGNFLRMLLASGDAWEDGRRGVVTETWLMAEKVASVCTA